VLKRTFVHIPGIGFKTERYIWQKDICFWEDFFENFASLGLPERKVERILYYLDSSITHLERKDIRFFDECLPKSEVWRLYSEFKDKAVFLDIETTGISAFYNKITIIGMYDGERVKSFIAGINLEDFLEEISRYSMVITYNGALFDIPFIKSAFPDFIPPVHLDLRFFLKRLGFSGGLKAVESQFGIIRTEPIQGLNGYDAVVLWKRYKRGDKDALKTLLEYNSADIVNMKTLLDEGYAMMEKKVLKFA
jgi:uncharacterized protein YprB with RNaseH-like and TPR domain